MQKEINNINYKKSITNNLLSAGIKRNITFKPYYLAIAGVNIIKATNNWPEVLLWYFSKKKKEINVHMRNGKSFVCSGSADLSMLTEIWAIEEYNPIGININNKDTIIDIGAHVGFFSIYAAHHAKKGKVYSYEPFKENYDKLVRNISTNKISNIKAYPIAVASKTENRKFFPSKTHNGCHSFFQRDLKSKTQTSTSLTVKTISLNDIFKKNKIQKCDFLKIDCEGAEVEILCAANAETLDKIHIIAGELHSDLLSKKDIDNMFNHLEKNTFNIIVRDGLFFAIKK